MPPLVCCLTHFLHLGFQSLVQVCRPFTAPKIFFYVAYVHFALPTALSVATRPTWLSAQVPTTICRSQHTPLPSFCIQQLNAQGETMAVHGTYTLLCNNKPCAQGTFVSGKPFVVNALANLASGKYKLLYSTPEADESSVEFLLFSDTDTQPADRENPLFFTPPSSLFASVPQFCLDPLATMPHSSSTWSQAKT